MAATDDLETPRALLARELVDLMGAHELRYWCSENGIKRKRGDRKHETALRAVDQRPDLVIEKLRQEGRDIP